MINNNDDDNNKVRRRPAKGGIRKGGVRKEGHLRVTSKLLKGGSKVTSK